MTEFKAVLVGWAIGLFLGIAGIFHYSNLRLLLERHWNERFIWVVISLEGTGIIIGVVIALIAYKLRKEAK